MFCQHCDKENQSDANYCSNCGKALKDEYELYENNYEPTPSLILPIIIAVLIPIIGLIMGIVMAVQKKRGVGKILLASLVGYIVAFILLSL